MSAAAELENGPAEAVEEIDALIVGAGFAGLYQLIHLREKGFNAKVYDMAGQIGGIWYWNCYPGARVDTEAPIYQYSREDLWRDWNYTERFPAWTEIRAYFRYVDEKLGLSKDVRLNTRIEKARWNEQAQRWLVATDKGDVVSTRYLIICTGFASKPNYPQIEGIEKFKGETAHPGRWPQEGVDFAGKNVGIIGTGSSAVQLTEQASLKARKLTLFQRTPAIALPLQQRSFSVEEQDELKKTYKGLFESRRHTFAGFDYQFEDVSWFDLTPEERLDHYQRKWRMGAFYAWLGTFRDLLADERVSNDAYDYWRKRVHARVKNPQTAETLAPEKPPYLFGTKRMPLEQWFYDAFNQDNVELVDLKKNPILRAREDGLETTAGFIPLDMIIFGTGFDAVHGGPASIDMVGTNGQSLAEYWNDGFRTALGVASANFPNLFFIYGPQSPAAWTNGPSTAEYQGEWVVACIEYMRDKGFSRIEAKPEAEEFWKKEIVESASATLLPRTASWWFGNNLPGREMEPLYYAGGLPRFLELSWASAKNGYRDFTLSREKALA